MVLLWGKAPLESFGLRRPLSHTHTQAHETHIRTHTHTHTRSGSSQQHTLPTRPFVCRLLLLDAGGIIIKGCQPLHRPRCRRARTRRAFYRRGEENSPFTCRCVCVCVCCSIERGSQKKRAKDCQPDGGCHRREEQAADEPMDGKEPVWQLIPSRARARAKGGSEFCVCVCHILFFYERYTCSISSASHT